MPQPIENIAKMKSTDLRDYWLLKKRQEPPVTLTLQLMRQILEYEQQADQYGELPRRIERKLLKSNGKKQRSSVAIGTKLIREWHGERHVVEVTKEGYLYRHKTYGSLSKIARFITGARWSGPRFFGLSASQKEETSK